MEQPRDRPPRPSARRSTDEDRRKDIERRRAAARRQALIASWLRAMTARREA